MANVIRDASTVLALRDAADGLEVFMVRRSSRLEFLGGVHAFPGGSVDDGDGDAGLDELATGFDPRAASAELRVDDPARARGFLVAAIRELFEEAGVLLARDESGSWADTTDPAGAERFATYRRAIDDGETKIATMLRAEGLRVACDVLAYFAHWITPTHQKKRFDTRFFLAPMPPRQRADHDRTENSEGAWMTPAAALESYRAKRIELFPPTICSLEWLAPRRNVADALAAASPSDVVEILPKVSVDGEAVTCLYPGDDDYEAGVAGPAVRGRGLERLELRDGLWVRPEV